MGSGELTSTMVSVHKFLIQRLGSSVRAMFLDTPAGFQLNVDQISEKACEYFKTHILQSMNVASFKSSDDMGLYDVEKSYQDLREANFIMIGPGSPSYAVRHWRQSRIPEILIDRIERGSCLVAASAAALTVGRFTVPVYEIYKVGEALHWVDGIDILGHFGLDLVVVPHWNNAEGGTHDTRFCYMGDSRFRQLESLLSEDIPIIGLDEHTACIMDLEKREASVVGIGRITVRFKGSDRIFEKGESFGFDVLYGIEESGGDGEKAPISSLPGINVSEQREDASFWDRVNDLEETIKASLDKKDVAKATTALLELDKVIWEAQLDLENDEFISQAREVLREQIVLLGLQLESYPSDEDGPLGSAVDLLLEVRESLRENGQWDLADRIRDGLVGAGIVVEDTGEGPRWRVEQVEKL